MAQGRRKRRWFIIPVVVVLGCMVLLVGCPLWFPWVLRPLAASVGVRYGAFHRASYSRFVAEDVSYTEPTVTVSAKRVDAFVPTIWLWHRFRDRRNSPRQYALVSGWKVVAVTHQTDSRGEVDQPSKSKSGAVPSTAKTVRSVQKILSKIAYWIPAATISQGSVQVDDILLAVSYAKWSRGRAEVGVDWDGVVKNGVLFVDTTIPATGVSTPGSLIRLRSATIILDSSVTPQSAGGFQFQSTNSWLGNPFEVSAGFIPGHVLPETAFLNAPSFVLPREVTHLDFYEPVKGSARVDWAKNRFEMQLAAGAHPVAEQSNLPPLTLNIQAYGDTNSATVRSADISAPWLKAELSREATFFFTGQSLRKPAAVKISGDLAKQPWAPLVGRIGGEVDFEPGDGQWPKARFQLAGSDVTIGSLANAGGAAAVPSALHDLKALDVRLEGSFVFPLLQLDSANVVFDDKAEASLRGNFDTQTKTVVGAVAKFRGPLLRRWLPAGWSYEGFAVDAKFDGSLERLGTSGQLTLTNLSSPDLSPLRASVAWSGEGLQLHQFAATLGAGKSSLEAVGSGELRLEGSSQGHAGKSITVELNRLNLAKSGEPQLQLRSPATITASVDKGRTSAQDASAPGISLSSFFWSGPAGEIRLDGHVSWPKTGVVQASIRNLGPAVVADFFTSNLPPVRIESLDLSGGWTNGPVNFIAEISASGWTNLVSAQLKALGGEHGVKIEQLLFTSRTSRVASAEGTLPATVWPASTNRFRFPPEAPLELRAVAQPAGLVWEKIGEATGLVFQHPSLSASISGNSQAPTGRVDFTAERVRFPVKGTNLLELAEIRLKSEIDTDFARIRELSLLVQQQPVAMTAQLPMTAARWRALFAGRVPDLQGTTGQLTVENAELTPLAGFYPGLISAQGLLNVKVVLEPDGEFAGNVTIKNARTRPVATAGPIRDIDIGLRFTGRSIELTNASGRVGANMVAASGKADLSGTEWLRGSVPPFEIRLVGTNMPVSRQPESIVRADVDLLVRHTNGAPPLISGTARLHDSYFLSDLRSLLPGGVSTPQRRPPFFSIEEPAVEDWRLAVDVKGTRFMRVRSPLFQGEITANLKLGGTLKEPTAIGDMRIESGIVRFPFANLEVQQGIVSLTPQNPYEPELSINAASKQYGYDIRMDVSGRASAPLLQFSSSPPLTSEQILLMVSAGELPGGAYSLTPQQRAQTIAVFLGRDVLAKLGYGDQAQQRLTLRSGEQISQQGRPTYLFEYQLTDRWSVTGEYDRFGEFNAGVKWRVYSK